LTLLLSYSLLLFYDSAWLTQGWLKEHIFFFHKSQDEPDLEHPFLSVPLGMVTAVSGQLAGMPSHRNPSILALGIILIEIFNEKSIENWRKAHERNAAGPNTNNIVAVRVVENMDPSPSRDAIEACLRMDWVHLTKPADLHDPDVISGFLKHVIERLEEEMDWISKY
jgi:hypothetical protein